jgi:hypothetical protein
MNGGAAVGVEDEVGVDGLEVDEEVVLEPAVAGGTAAVVVVTAGAGSGVVVEQPARTAARHTHTVTANAARGARASREAVMSAIITNRRRPGRHSAGQHKWKGAELPSTLNV